MDRKKISTFKIAATYIGTIVGAGFATGQEMMQFFAPFGIYGLWGIALATVLFIVFGYIIINLGFQVHAHSHLDILEQTNGKLLRFVMDIIISFFLFGALTAMFAGTGALAAQQFGLPGIWGNLLMAVITAFTVFTGIEGVINSISFIVPFLLVVVFGICLFTIFTTPPDMASGAGIEKSGFINNWVFSAILYISYNTVISVAVIGPLGAQAKDKKAILAGSILGGLGLGLGSALMFLALFGNIGALKDIEVPMAHVAERISNWVQIAFAIILVAEVYTTAVGSLYGFTARLQNTKKPIFNGKGTIIVTTILAFLASLFGFSNLVKYLYPIVGYGGILLLISLLYKGIKTRLSKKNSRLS